MAGSAKACLPKSAKSPDAYVKRLVTKSPNLLVPHFLMHSYLYYVCDWPIVSDDTFDRVLVKGLEAKWGAVEHRHKALIDPEILKSGFYLKYPKIVGFAATALADHFKPGCMRPWEAPEGCFLAPL